MNPIEYTIKWIKGEGIDEEAYKYYSKRASLALKKFMRGEAKLEEFRRANEAVCAVRDGRL